MDRNITQYFPSRLAAALNEVRCDDINEIRLRTDKPVSLVSRSGISYLMNGGGITKDSSKGITVSSDEIKRTFDAACQYSLHSFQSQIGQCFITVHGGHRLGICGTAVMNGDRLENIRDISSICFRIARQVIGAADELYKLISEKGLKSILVCGEPSAGKTTVLRDLCRQLGERFNVSLIDTRNEISADCRGRSYNDVGTNTDVFSGFSKAHGIVTALRVMSPSVIVCDEIGTEEDSEAIENALCCGVKLIASAHGSGAGDMMKRKMIRRLIEKGAFEYCASVSGGVIREITQMGEYNEAYGNNPHYNNSGNGRKRYG
ncbi:MAG: stage III sporulation protein AA [Oscillospiraceae bacterium]|nr:stage III sporulation protein AA [Oscillospiraceae bacterium]